MITHSILKKEVKKENHENVGFLLNNSNIYFSLGFNKNFSNFQGLFSFSQEKPFKQRSG